MNYTVSIGENVMDVEYDDKDGTVFDVTFDQVDEHALYVIVDGKFVTLAKRCAELATEQYMQDDEVPLADRQRLESYLGG